MRSFQFTFEELPLTIFNGVEAGFVNGQAEISYSSEYFEIGEITLEGFGERVNGRRQWPQVPAPEAIATIIRSRLEGEWHHKVHDAFIEQLAEDREEAAEYRAEQRREDRMGVW